MTNWKYKDLILDNFEFKIYIQNIYVVKNAVFWDVALCRSYVNRRFGGRYRHLLTLVPRSRIFLPWRWRRYVPPKRRFKQDLHGATSQKTAFFIVTAVKISNLTTMLYFKLDRRSVVVWYTKTELQNLLPEHGSRWWGITHLAVFYSDIAHPEANCSLPLTGNI
jgi:hypothetical protein